jgi:hypothetical protein
VSSSWEFGWAAIGSLATACSIFLGVLVFWRDSKIREFEICDRLERRSEEIWIQIRDPGNKATLEERVKLAFNHYELCASYLNSLKVKGRVANNLKQHIFEVVGRALHNPEVVVAIKKCCTSPSTYMELRALLNEKNLFLPGGV